jgi:hypothetical protein
MSSAVIIFIVGAVIAASLIGAWGVVRLRPTKGGGRRY